MPGRNYAHVNWQSLRDLIAQGASLRDLSKLFDIPYRTLACRSHRERWNVMAIRAGLNLPKRTQQERKALQLAASQIQDTLPQQAQEIRNNFASALLKLSRFYKDADLKLLRKDSRQILQNVYAASKLLGWNDGKHGENSPTVNLQMLALKPAELAQITREVQAALPDSPSSEAQSQVADSQGPSSVREAKN